MKKLLVLSVALMLIGSTAVADEAYYIELMKTDIKARKMELVDEFMNLSAAQAKQFWPVYKKYQKELSKLNEKELRLIKKYADNVDRMTEDVAKEIAHDAFELDIARGYLKKKYYRQFAFATDGITAARFFQIENQLGLLIELQIAAVLPLME
jgi:Tfp pilus assembly pilus retraction ATPase PilT